MKDLSAGRTLSVLSYKMGNKALQNSDLEEAEKWVTSAVSREPGNAAWTERLGFIVEKKKQYDRALSLYERAIALDSSHGEWFYRSGVCRRELGDKMGALSDFETCLSIDPTHDRAGKALAGVIPSRLPQWRRRDLLKAAADACTDMPVQLAYARVLFCMDQFLPAEKVLSRLKEQEKLKDEDVTLLARTEIELGNPSKAWSLLQPIAEESSDDLVKARGAGHFAERENEWPSAQELYTLSWQRGQRTPEVAFGVAYALDRQYLWNESIPWYRRALTLHGGDRHYWNYKYAHALERIGAYEEAADAYARALSLGGNKQWNWFYRMGVCQLRLGNLDSAFGALAAWAQRSVSLDVFEELASMQTAVSVDDTVDKTRSNGGGMALSDRLASAALTARIKTFSASEVSLENPVQLWLEQARAAASQQHEHEAAELYSKHLQARATPNKQISCEAAVSLWKCGEKERACHALMDAREFERPDGLDLKKAIRSSFDRRRLRYAEYCSRFPVDPHIVLFESFWGTKTSDSPLAIYEEMRQDSRFADSRFYWTVAPGATVSERLVNDGRTILLEYGSVLYDRVLATAEILVNNTSFVEYFQRRDGQQYLNTWHGTPLKTLGKRIGTGVLEHANVTRNLLNSTCLFMPNRHTADALVNDYDLNGFARTEVTIGGSPRLDIVVRANEEVRKRVLLDIGVDPEEPGRIVFYAPTWRGSDDQRKMDLDGAMEAISAMSAVPGVTVLFRAHHLAEKLMRDTDVDAIVVPSDIDTYDVLTCTDVLVTDYSSLLFDFLPTGRRVISYAPDLEEYVTERGVYMRPSDVLDDVATTLDDLVAMLSEHLWVPGSTYIKSAREFCCAEDGNASRRAVDLLVANRSVETRAVTRGSADEVGPAPRVVVFAESLIPNGIRSSMLNLMRMCDPREYSFGIVVNVHDVVDHDERREGLEELPEHVRVFGRTGQTVATPEERYAIAEFTRHRGRVSAELLRLVDSAYQREFRRVLGTPRNVTFIDFEGYSSFWDSLFSRGCPNGCTSGVFLHNQMGLEADEKFAHLNELFQNCASFGGVASVADAISAENAEAFSSRGVVLRQHPSVVHNLIDFDTIHEKAEIGENIWDRYPTANPRLISLGRLSPEKNHELLLEMFSSFRRTHPSAELMILGQGLREGPLKSMAVELGLAESVHFMGFVANPMKTVESSDLFVLTSMHEGQPMVLFEAMALGVPIVCTPVPGSAEAVEMGRGIVSTFDPVELGMDCKRSLENPDRTPFDLDPYNKRALNEFARFVGSLPVNEDAAENETGKK